MNHEEWLELAKIYALGALDGEDLVRFESHLHAGCVPCVDCLADTSDLLHLIPESLRPIVPPPTVKAALFDQIRTAHVRATPGLTFVQAEEGEWQELAPGVMAKFLHVDTAQKRGTALVKMAAGSRYGTHRHAQMEELYILKGGCYCGGRLLREGDYHRAETGSVHVDTYAEEESVMLIMTSLENEMLAE